MTELCTHISDSAEIANVATYSDYFPDVANDNVATASSNCTTTNPADAFRNMFAILHNLDQHELAGIASGNNPWPPASLTTFVLKLDDARLDALWGLVQARQPERYREPERAVDIARRAAAQMARTLPPIAPQ